MGSVILAPSNLVQPHTGRCSWLISYRSGLLLHLWQRQLPLLPWHKRRSFASTRAHLLAARFSRALEVTATHFFWCQPELQLHRWPTLFTVAAWVAPHLALIAGTTLGSGQFTFQMEVSPAVARWPSSMRHMHSMFNSLVWLLYQSLKKKKTY